VSAVTTSIEIYADIWCPFAHVGLRAARRERERLGRTDVFFLVRPWPLELVNGAPLDPHVTAQHVRELREQVAPELFSNFDEGSFPTSTLPALSLARAAYERDAATGEAVSWALRDALFESGQDISDARVLDSIARQFAVSEGSSRDTAGVELEWHRGQSRGVKGSPHFFCGKSDTFCPALDIARNETGDVQLRVNAKGLMTFLEVCLGGAER
jgi:predicted DsbA family dithiol-disulfide isomerase